MSSIDVLSRTQRVVVNYTQRIVVVDKVVSIVHSNNSVDVFNAGPPGASGPPGPPGTAGSRRWYGEGPPGTIVGSAPNDEYLDTLTGNLYTLQ